MPEGVFISPQLVSQSLSGITHRFVLILECETRHYDESGNQRARYAPPRFCVGGPRANQDPRIVPVKQLIGITTVNRNDIAIPPGWEKVHQYIYVLHGNTDDHGWQYRSDWSEGVLEPQDEQWIGVHTEQHEVRRRIWMTTVVKRDDLIRAKRILSESLIKGSTGDILQGNLLKLSDGSEGKSWLKRSVRLRLDGLEFWMGDANLGDMSLSTCEVKMLHGSQCPGKEYAFTVRDLSGDSKVIIDAGHKETRRRWVVAIGYQIAIHWPDVNFPPFDYGPPTGDDASSRVLICGDLLKQGHLVKNWKARYFQLTPKELQYFEKDLMKGKVSIDEAILKFGESSLDFTLKGASGAVLVMKAETQQIKETWIKSIKRAIQALKDVKIAKPTLSQADVEELMRVDEKDKERIKIAEAEAAAAPPAPVETVEMVEEPIAPIAEKQDETIVTVEEVSIDVPPEVVENAFNDEPSEIDTLEVVDTTSTAAAVAEEEKVVQEDVVEEEDENETYIDPYLQYGGAYGGDKKDTDFKYISFAEYPKFSTDHKSLMAKHLTPELFVHVKDLCTSKGYTLSNAIMTGVVIPGLQIGVTAGDEESYELFKDLFNPIIASYHNYDPTGKAQASDLDASKLTFTNAQKTLFNEYVVSSSMRASRNISGFSMPAGTSTNERASVETAMKTILSGMSGSFSGTYRSLSTFSEDETKDLLEKGLFFQIPASNHLLTGAGAARAWPTSRGIFSNTDNSALVWVNEADHARIISSGLDGDVVSVFSQFAEFVTAFGKSVEEKGHKLMKSEQLGYLVTCPSGLGTGLSAVVTIRLPAINKLMGSKKKSDHAVLQKVCEIFDLIAHGANGPFTAADGAKFVVSSRQRLGITEIDLVQKLIDGINAIIEVEKQLVSHPSTDKAMQFIRSGFKHATATIDTKSCLPSTLRRASSTNMSPMKPVEEDEEVDDEDDFGMKEVHISASVEARMKPSLVKAISSKRSSFVLSQIAKHETYFDKNGVDKNAKSLGAKQVYYKFK